MENNNTTISVKRYEELIKNEAEHEIMLKLLKNARYTQDVDDVLKLFGIDRREV